MDGTALRYLLVGGGLFALDGAVFFSLSLGLGVGVMAAQLMSRSAGALAGFFLHRSVTFRRRGAQAPTEWAAQGSGYVVVTLWNILISPPLVYAMVQVTGGSLLLGKVLAEGILVAQTYVLLRWLFTGVRTS